MRAFYCRLACLQFEHWASFRIMACFPPGRGVSEENTFLNVAFLTQSPDHKVHVIPGAIQIIVKMLRQYILCKINQSV